MPKGLVNLCARVCLSVCVCTSKYPQNKTHKHRYRKEKERLKKQKNKNTKRKLRYLCLLGDLGPDLMCKDVIGDLSPDVLLWVAIGCSLLLSLSPLTCRHRFSVSYHTFPFFPTCRCSNNNKSADRVVSLSHNNKSTDRVVPLSHNKSADRVVSLSHNNNLSQLTGWYHCHTTLSQLTGWYQSHDTKPTDWMVSVT